jgi:hypothetical protein
MLIDGISKLGWHSSSRLPDAERVLRVSAARLCKDAPSLLGRHVATLLAAIAATNIPVEPCDLGACLRRLTELLRKSEANAQVQLATSCLMRPVNA